MSVSGGQVATNNGGPQLTITHPLTHMSTGQQQYHSQQPYHTQVGGVVPANNVEPMQPNAAVPPQQIQATTAVPQQQMQATAVPPSYHPPSANVKVASTGNSVTPSMGVVPSTSADSNIVVSFSVNKF